MIGSVWQGAAGAEDPQPPAELDKWWEYGLFDVGSSTVQVIHLVQIAAVILAAFLISRLVQRAIYRSFTKRELDDEGTLHVAQRLTHYVVMTIGVFVGFKVGNIDLTALFAAGAVFAVVIGFAMQNISENFVAGVILMVERAIKPGDIIEVDGRMVRVRRMGIRATVARTRDEEEMIVPNSLMVKATVKNYTLGDRLFRLRTTVGVTYGSDMRRVREVLEQAADGIPFRSQEMEPRVLMWGFGSSSVDWDVSVWMENPWHEQSARSELNETIWNALADAGITIAFPQLDLHLDDGVEQALQRLSAGR